MHHLNTAFSFLTEEFGEYAYLRKHFQEKEKRGARSNDGSFENIKHKISYEEAVAE